MTMQIKGYPFEVHVAGRNGGVVLADQLKSLDWRARNARLSHRASADELAQTQAMIRALLF